MTFESMIPWMLQYWKRYKSHDEIFLDHFENNVVLPSSYVTPQFPLPTPKTLGESQTRGGICLPPDHTTCSSQPTPNSCPLSKKKLKNIISGRCIRFLKAKVQYKQFMCCAQ